MLLGCLFLAACAKDRAGLLRAQIREHQHERPPALLSRAQWGASQDEVIERAGTPSEKHFDRVLFERDGHRGCVEEEYDFTSNHLMRHRCVHEGPADEVDSTLIRLLGPPLRKGRVESAWLTADTRVLRRARTDGSVEITDEPVPVEVPPAPGLLPL
jgi:hypothetical protein